MHRDARHTTSHAHIAIVTKQNLRHKRQTKSAHHYFEPLVNWSAAQNNVCDFLLRCMTVCLSGLLSLSGFRPSTEGIPRGHNSAGTGKVM